MSNRHIDGAIAEKIAAYTERQPNGCLLWVGNVGKSSKRKRGMIRDGDKVVSAHRASYERANGPVPAGHCVLSTCPAGHGVLCIEPDHLALGTQGDVNRATVAKGRRAKHRRRAMVEGDL